MPTQMKHVEDRRLPCTLPRRAQVNTATEWSRRCWPQAPNAWRAQRRATPQSIISRPSTRNLASTIRTIPRSWSAFDTTDASTTMRTGITRWLQLPTLWVLREKRIARNDTIPVMVAVETQIIITTITITVQMTNQSQKRAKATGAQNLARKRTTKFGSSIWTNTRVMTTIHASSTPAVPTCRRRRRHRKVMICTGSRKSGFVSKGRNSTRHDSVIPIDCAWVCMWLHHARAVHDDRAHVGA
mmetsp:Transcript_5183/g.7628  ORF Transcript_5183/g.7628 Transcript_5183/m.7628 type:complete len:242 (-) Transcript_5183:266-991(-)